jgi:hypothetical protein
VRPTIVLYLIKSLLSSFGLIIKNMYTISVFVSGTCILTLSEKYITWWMNRTFLIFFVLMFDSISVLYTTVNII